MSIWQLMVFQQMQEYQTPYTVLSAVVKYCDIRFFKNMTDNWKIHHARFTNRNHVFDNYNCLIQQFQLKTMLALT